MDLIVVVDSRVWLPPGLPRDFLRDLRAEFTYSNPDHWRKKAMGFATWNTPAQIRTMDEREDARWKRPTLPRGGLSKLRTVATAHGYRLRFLDCRTSAPANFPTFRVGSGGARLRPYQEDAIARALEKQQGVIRAPTGSGKTIAALGFIARAQERALVIMRDGNLLKQWARVAAQCLDLDPSEIGIIRGGKKYRKGAKLTLALQQSLYRKGNNLDEILAAEPFGAVVVDEVQTVAAQTFQDVIDRFPAKYRIGFSADETRKDKKEFLIYDEMGPVICEISRRDLEDRGVIHPVTVRVVPTDFRADWYRGADPGDRDFGRLIEEMTQDEARNALILEVVEELVASREIPVLVFTHRREHAEELADRELSVKRGILCGLLLGSDEDRERFQDDRTKLESGRLAVAAGTFNAIGVGIDLPVVRAGVVATPISGSNPQFFGQVRGRICRTSEGKDDAVIVYLWDRHVFPNQLRKLQDWNDGRVEIREGDRWVRVAG